MMRIAIATEEGIMLTLRNMKAKALVANTNASLVPGLYANVKLELKENKKCPDGANASHYTSGAARKR